MNKKTAILVFVNSAKEELLHKPILGGEQLFVELTQKTRAIAERSGLPFFVVTEKNQIGTTFGERFINAVQSTYDLGFENVITIGNDTPHLKKQHLVESARQLENNKFVLGPSADGGFYLMGLHKSQFNPDTFLNLPWQSKDLAKSIAVLINTSKTEIVQLGVLYDIDSLDDLKKIARLSFSFSKVLKAIIYSLIHAIQEIVSDITFIKNTHHLRTFYNKGSPIPTAFNSYNI